MWINLLLFSLPLPDVCYCNAIYYRGRVFVFAKEVEGPDIVCVACVSVAIMYVRRRE